jgi:hypothetical protein
MNHADLASFGNGFLLAACMESVKTIVEVAVDNGVKFIF